MGVKQTGALHELTDSMEMMLAMLDKIAWRLDLQNDSDWKSMRDMAWKKWAEGTDKVKGKGKKEGKE